jgi:hypothetical protein
MGSKRRDTQSRVKIVCPLDLRFKKRAASFERANLVLKPWHAPKPGDFDRVHYEISTSFRSVIAIIPERS